MSIKKCVADVLDLPSTIAMKEAPSKLGQTYMFVNGMLMYVNEIDESRLYVSSSHEIGAKSSIDGDDVESLKLWLPKTGVYFKKDSTKAVLLRRLPMRQWRRSFSTSFYEVLYLDDEAFSLSKVDPNTHKEFWVKPNKTIMYMENTVGYIKDSSSIVCTTKYLEQELADWARVL